LADRIGERDEGNKPMINERVPYIYIKTPPGVEIKLQGDRIEHPDYIKENNLVPDYKFYITNQLKKPIGQLYTLCVEQLPGYAFDPGYWIEIESELLEKDIYKNDKKRKSRLQALKMKVVDELLFQEFIDKLTPEGINKKTRKNTKSEPKEAKVKKKSEINKSEVKKESEEQEVSEEVKPKKKAIKKILIDDPYTLILTPEIYKRKINKYKTKIRLINNQNKILWEDIDEGNKKLSKTDDIDIIYGSIQSLEKSLKYILENYENKKKIKIEGNSIFIHKLRTILEIDDIESYLSQLTDIINGNNKNDQTSNLRMMKDIEEFINIINDMKKINYEI
jgi:hypothetical protein